MDKIDTQYISHLLFITESFIHGWLLPKDKLNGSEILLALSDPQPLRASMVTDAFHDALKIKIFIFPMTAHSHFAFQNELIARDGCFCFIIYLLEASGHIVISLCCFIGQKPLDSRAGT